MIAEKDKLQNECKELKEQLDLYVKSHPLCMATAAEPVEKVVEEVKVAPVNDDDIKKAIAIVVKCMALKDCKKGTPG